MTFIIGETDANLDGLVYIGVGDHVGGSGGVRDVVIGAIGAAHPLVAEYVAFVSPLASAMAEVPAVSVSRTSAVVPAIVGCPVAATLGVVTTTSVAWLVRVSEYPSSSVKLTLDLDGVCEVVSTE